LDLKGLELILGFFGDHSNIPSDTIIALDSKMALVTFVFMFRPVEVIPVPVLVSAHTWDAFELECNGK
jgi:hypothetical protein